MRRIPAPLLLLVSGVLTAATLIWPVLAPLEWVSMVPMGGVLLREASRMGKRRGPKLWGLGLCYFIPFFCIGYHWFIELYPLSFVGLEPTAAAGVVLLGCLGLGTLHGALTALVFPVCGSCFRSPLCRQLPWLRIPIAAGLFCIAEWVQTTGWLGVPWSRLALGQVGWLPVLQTVSIGGSYLLTLLLVAVNLCLAEALLARRLAERRVMAALLIFGINFTVGSGIFLIDEFVARERNTVVVAATQGNISSHEKWSSDMLTPTLETYTDLTLAAAAEGAELVVWPETAVPYTLRRYREMIEYLELVSERSGADLLVGAFSEDEDGSYNSIHTITTDAGLMPGAYSKRHLVPFGEYLPMEDFFERFVPALTELRMQTADLEPGKGAAVRDLGGVRIGSMICFDSIYEGAARDAVRNGANLLTLSTNDSWFGASAGVRQHNAQAILRAVEMKRSVVRAANTGISSIIDPRGRVLAQIEPLVVGQITAEVELCDSKTVYAIAGNWGVALAGIGLGACLISAIGGRIACRRVSCKTEQTSDKNNA